MEPSVVDLFFDRLETVLEDGDFVLYRSGVAVNTSSTRSALVVMPRSAQPRPTAVRMLEHEHSLRDELDPAWALRATALTTFEGRPALVFDDPGGELLIRHVGTAMEIGDVLRVGAGLVSALCRLHRRGLIHKDVKPANVMTDWGTGRVWLRGFGLASRLPRERRPPEPPEFIVGTLAYMAPEQTGWVNRSIDARSDLYAAGVVLYELSTGQLPFTASDPMGWVHSHIAKRAVPPVERRHAIPEVVSAIVMKLLAKTAEDRYQTAGGLEHDLQRCLAQWEADGRIDAFPLAEHDIPDGLVIPEKLYGRGREIETLLGAFERVVSSGTPELVLVSGYSGIGKSSLVNELHKVLVPPRALFASGKFDQYKRDVPYATLAQAFQSLVRGLLGKSDAELSGWRDVLMEVLGPNGPLMIELAPELKLIIGDQPPVPDLPAQDARRRFQLVFRRLIGVFARPDHPLVLFLDDLQWLDAATLDLLEVLLTPPGVRYLILIGAYRNSEVTAAHPLARTLEAIRNAGANVQEIALAPLAYPFVRQFVADALRCDVMRVASLAQVVHEKAAGNPFFIVQFLQTLAEEGWLAFNHDRAQWSWDLDRISAKQYRDNVVDLMVGKLNRLPRQTQLALQQLSCLGHSADLATLAIVRGTSEEQVDADLSEAVRLELIERLGGAYQFVHDRVQEAAYSLIPEEQHDEAHLRIGRRLAAHIPLEQREVAIFDIVNQFNRGVALITSRDEREQVAGLNLLAGKRARASAAYASALRYLVASAALLPPDSWERQHAMSFELELHRAECEFLIGALATAEERLTALSTRAATAVEQATVSCLLMDVHTTLGQSGRAIAVGLEFLRRVGIGWSSHPTDEDAHREYDRVLAELGSRTSDELIELPLMSDPAALATLDVLTRLIPTAMFTDANLLALVICQAIGISLERGHTDGSCFAYIMLGQQAALRFADYPAASRFGQLGYDLVERRGLTRFQSRIYLTFGSVILPLTRHVRGGRELVRRAFEAAHQVGDLTFACYSCILLNLNMLVAGDPLNETQREAENGLAFAQNMRFGFAVDSIATHLGFIRTLRGLTPKFGTLNDEQFDEQRIERHFADNPGLALSECWYWTRKLQARYLAGDYAAALEASSQVQRLLYTSPSPVETADFHFYDALSHAASCGSAAADHPHQHVEALAAHHRQLAVWAENGPETFGDRAALLGAEIARIEGRHFDAEQLYEQAIRSARACGFVQNEGLAYELAARFWAARGIAAFSDLYLRNARHCYQRWGADGKVRQLDEAYPRLSQEEPALDSRATIAAPVEHLELATVLKVSQAVSGEVVFEKLVETVLRTAIEHAGAERGLLLLPRGNELLIRGKGETRDGSVVVSLRETLVSAAELPESVVRYAARTQETVILDDGSAWGPFSADEYERAQRPRSALCLPLIKQGTLVALLYLENRVASGVFVRARMAVLKLLAGQAAISLETSSLYRELQEREAEIRQLVDSNIIGIFIWDLSGRILEANDAFLEIIGYQREDLLSGRLRWTDLTPPEILEMELVRLLPQIRLDGWINPWEKEYFHKDGHRVPVLIGAAPFDEVASFDDQSKRGWAFILDLTERKRAEEARRRVEAYLVEAQRLSHTGSWAFSAAGFEYWSSELFQIHGVDADGRAPSTEEYLRLVHPDDRESVADAIRMMLADYCGFDFTKRIVRPDGEIRLVRCVGNPAMHGGASQEFVGTAVDVTEKRQLEQEHERLRRLEANLAHKNRVSMMGEMAASLAHEIKQPIAAARIDAKVCLRALADDRLDLEAAREAASRMINDASRADEIIRRTTALYKKDTTNRERVEVNAVIREMTVLLGQEASASSISIQTNLADGIPYVMADRVQLQQVFMNLMLNAIEAMKETGGQLTITSQPGEGAALLISVSDTGMGLPTEGRDQIFDSFVTTKPHGTGMGLAITRSIVEAHGGRLWAIANSGAGATFLFTWFSQAGA